MKFTVEVDEEDFSISSLQAEVVDQIATKMIYNYLNLEQIKKQANDEIEKKKKELIETFKSEIKTWDKLSIFNEVQQLFGNGWKVEVAKKVVELLKYDTTFINQISKEIIQTQFSK